MGARANLVLVTRDGVKLGKDHYAANGLYRISFWGPDFVLPWLQSIPSVEQLYDPVWCEGAIIINTDERTVTIGTRLGYNLLDISEWAFLKGEEAYHPPNEAMLWQHFFAMFQSAWMGWQVLFVAMEEIGRQIKFGSYGIRGLKSITELPDSIPYSYLLSISRQLFYDFDKFFECTRSVDGYEVRRLFPLLINISKDRRADVKREADIIEFVLLTLLPQVSINEA